MTRRSTWAGQTIVWKNSDTWVPRLSRWIRPYLNRCGIRALQKNGPLDLHDDDSEWLRIVESVLDCDADELVECLSEALGGAHIRMYHGCRTEDATPYLVNGILLNDPEQLAERLRSLVATVPGLEIYREKIEQDIRDFDAKERDSGTVYLALDDRSLIHECGHYLLYGSEWIQCILGFPAHAALRSWGAPTIIQADVPAGELHPSALRELAENLVHEWTRTKVNRPKTVQRVSFGVPLHKPVPPQWIAGHEHPGKVRCPFNGGHLYESPRMTCFACEPTGETQSSD